MKNAKQALRWIVAALEKRGVRYQITGGLAAKIYGSKRKLADIDIAIPEKDFPKILPDVRKYVQFGPASVRGKKWRAERYMKLNYQGQVIELDGAYKTKIFDKKAKRWVKYGIDLTKAKRKTIYGLRIPVIPKKSLIRQKKILSRKVDKSDLLYLEKKRIR
jgi:hypothetical protein